MRFSVETWAPEYGFSADADTLAEASDTVDPAIEVTPTEWSPIRPDRGADTVGQVLFIDGVRRIDARVWIHDGDRAHVGVCASVAAGTVVCDASAATVRDVHVRRGLFAPANDVADAIHTRHGSYEYRPVVGDDPEAVYNGIHEMMTELELAAARSHDCDLVVFDGPLRGRNDPAGVGYVKTQQVQYLPDELAPILGRLGDGDRTPLVLIGSRSWRRYSWYLRLPGPRHQPLSGVVRLELPAVGPVVDAAARATQISALLPRFASAPHREPRAPQNLYPIAGLEHQLRHRLGDALLLERSLRLAAR